jgi:hypothetical protein
LHARSSNELPSDRVDDGFEPGVRSELPVDVVQVMAQRLRRDAQFPLDVAGTQALGEPS